MSNVNLLPSLCGDDDAADDTFARSQNPTKDHYITSNRTLLSLVVMSIGLCNEDGSALLDPDARPWKTMKKKSVKPCADDLSEEVLRRWHTFVSGDSSEVERQPHPRNWDKKELMRWLEEYPISAAEDISFLRATVAERKTAAEDATNKSAAQIRKLQGDATTGTEAKSTTDDKKNKHKNWTGRYPYLRLMHALVDNDEIKSAYIHRDDAPSGRMTVENRKTPEAQAASVWQMLADKWNDESFAPATEKCTDLHAHYEVSETIGFDKVNAFIRPTAAKAKDRFESMMLVLKRIIPKWEKSGQGDGGHHGDDDDDNPLKVCDDNKEIIDNDDINDSNESDCSGDSGCSDDSSVKICDGSADNGKKEQQPKWGEFVGRTRFALSKRQDFFQNTNSYVLYLWHLIDKHGLIGTSMNMLADGIGSSDGARGIPSVIGQSSFHSSCRDDDGSLGSKTTKGSKTDEDILSVSIQEHGLKLIDFGKMRSDEHQKDRQMMATKAKRKQLDTVEAQLDALRAEKRQLVIQLCTIPVGSNVHLQEAIESSIVEVNSQIERKEKQLADIEMPTPVKSNCTPDDKQSNYK